MLCATCDKDLQAGVKYCVTDVLFWIMGRRYVHSQDNPSSDCIQLNMAFMQVPAANAYRRA